MLVESNRVESLTEFTTHLSFCLSVCQSLWHWQLLAKVKKDTKKLVFKNLTPKRGDASMPRSMALAMAIFTRSLSRSLTLSLSRSSYLSLSRTLAKPEVLQWDRRSYVRCFWFPGLESCKLVHLGVWVTYEQPATSLLLPFIILLLLLLLLLLFLIYACQ